MDEDRFAISDEAWKKVEPLLPGETGDTGATGRNNRRPSDPGILGLRVQAHYGRNAERTAPLPTSEAILLWH